MVEQRLSLYKTLDWIPSTTNKQASKMFKKKKDYETSL